MTVDLGAEFGSEPEEGKGARFRGDLDHTDMVDPRQTRFVTAAELVEQHAKATLEGVLVRLRPKVHGGLDEHRGELGVIAGGSAWRG